MSELDGAIERVSRGLVAGIDDEWKDDIQLILNELERRMRVDTFDRLMESVREADAMLYPQASACHRLVQSDPYYDSYVDGVKRFMERLSTGERPSADEIQRRGLDRIYELIDRCQKRQKAGDES